MHFRPGLQARGAFLLTSGFQTGRCLGSDCLPSQSTVLIRFPDHPITRWAKKTPNRTVSWNLIGLLDWKQKQSNRKKGLERRLYTFQGCEQSQFQLTTGKIPRALLFYRQVYLFPYVRPCFSSRFIRFHSFECICPVSALLWELRGIKTAASYFHDFSLLQLDKLTTKLFLCLACAYQMCGSKSKEAVQVQKGLLGFHECL